MPARISLIVARARNGVIGANGRLPWHLPADLRHFRRLTMGKPVLMGRRTYQSIGRPLPGRENLILTRNVGFQAPGCTCVYCWEEALRLAAPAPELMVIGGAELYRQLLPHAERIYLSEIEADFPGELRFPALRAGEWIELCRERRAADARNPCALSFITLQRRVSGAAR